MLSVQDQPDISVRSRALPRILFSMNGLRTIISIYQPESRGELTGAYVLRPSKMIFGLAAFLSTRT